MVYHTFINLYVKCKELLVNSLFLLLTQYTIYGGCFQDQILYKVKIGSFSHANIA